MVQEKIYYLTKEGLEKIKKEYKILKGFRSAKIKGEAPRILESEDLNPEYLSFQEDLSLTETRIAELENVFKNAKLIKNPRKEKQHLVNLGATVSVEIDDEADEFKIVGTLEADPLENKISDESPIGKALLGKKKGETVVVRVPAKAPIVNHSCKIKKIKYNKA